MPSCLLCFCFIDSGKSQVWIDHRGPRHGWTGCWVNRHGHGDNHDRWQKWSLSKIHQERGKRPPPTSPAVHSHDCWSVLIPCTTAPAGSRFANENPPCGRGGVVFLFHTFSCLCLLCVRKAEKSIVRTKALNLVKVHKKIPFNAKVPFS